jgi:HEAT repeat protein
MVLNSPRRTAFATPPAEVDHTARWHETAALGGQVGRAAVQQLLASLGDQDPLVRWQAGMALERTAEALRQQARRGAPTWDRQAPELTFSGLLMLLRASLQDPDPQRRAATADALALWDHEMVITFLMQALTDAEPVVRTSVARALGQLGDKTALGALCAALSDPSLWVRRAAADALGAIGDVEAVPALVQALADTQSLVRASVVCALGHLPCRQTREILERYTHDEDPALRWYAARSLGQVGDLNTLTTLQRMQQDEALLLGQTVAATATAAIAAIRLREQGFWHWLRRLLSRLARALGTWLSGSLWSAAQVSWYFLSVTVWNALRAVGTWLRGPGWQALRLLPRVVRRYLERGR